MAKFTNTAETSHRCKGYAPLQFTPSEDVIIEKLNRNGKCYIHFHIVGRTVVTKVIENIKSTMTGPSLYNNIRDNLFLVNNDKMLIEKIVVSIHHTSE